MTEIMQNIVATYFGVGVIVFGLIAAGGLIAGLLYGASRLVTRIEEGSWDAWHNVEPELKKANAVHGVILFVFGAIALFILVRCGYALAQLLGWTP